MKKAWRIAVVGSAGIPARYGGFETLAENLARYHAASGSRDELTVYCSGKDAATKAPAFLSARLRYVPLRANGVQSVPYDIVSLFLAAWRRSDAILLLGVSGAIALPWIRLFSRAKIVTNVDGIEWRREKWRGWAKAFLRFSEKVAVRFSHQVISDNTAIADYLRGAYGVDSAVIAYGGDQAVSGMPASLEKYEGLPEGYALSVCRVEPENNIHLILEAFSKLESRPLVLVGNWNQSAYGKRIRERHSAFRNLFLLDPVYESGELLAIRLRASLYVHGHSAGGTNPSLVEAMHFGRPVLAFDCAFNRNTTEGKALFFKSAEDLIQVLGALDGAGAEKVGREMLEIARRRYTWKAIAEEYFALLRTTA